MRQLIYPHNITFVLDPSRLYKPHLSTVIGAVVESSTGRGRQHVTVSAVCMCYGTCWGRLARPPLSGSQFQVRCNPNPNFLNTLLAPSPFPLPYHHPQPPPASFTLFGTSLVVFDTLFLSKHGRKSLKGTW
jgi:hypothetical protein